jgi:DNA-3-methyladenine glycosylase II
LITEVVQVGEEHLRRVEPRLVPILDRNGPCTLKPDRNFFDCTTRAIIAQLISTAAAKTITGRVEALAGEPLDPEAIRACGSVALRGCGLSQAKVQAILELAERFVLEPGLTEHWHSLSDEALRNELLAFRGVGPWTVDMLMIFALGRPDIWPTGDLGVRAAVQDLLGLSELPRPAEMIALAEPWQPYRTLVSWHLWRSRGWVPKS